MVLAEFSMFPTDRGESVSKYVAEILKVIDESSITYQLTPMGTVLEGSWDDVMSVISACFKTMEPYSNRIYSSIKIDYRRGDQSRMKSKTDKIETVLDRKLKTS
ncbi:MTH1187 family thiamine-binding protein [candidate division KSB1 bacterium]|nr:MTH1187 family thiamine-binding protein [candidate division KSB1 bacterium]